MFGLAVGKRPGAGDEGALSDCLGEALRASCVFEELWRTYGRSRLAPVRDIWRHHNKLGKGKIGHRARHRTDVEGVARRYENNIDPVALGLGKQELIVLWILMLKCWSFRTTEIYGA